MPTRNPSLISHSLPRLRVLLALLAAAVVWSRFDARPVRASDATTVAVLKRVEAKSRAVAAQVLGATVGVINQSLAGNGRLGEGSGVVVDRLGHVLTNFHVIEGAREIRVTLYDGKTYTARLVGGDPDTDQLTGARTAADDGWIRAGRVY